MFDWSKVAIRLESFAHDSDCDRLDQGQRASIAELARRIKAGKRAVLVADEVGMGKTRIAIALIEAVREAGGRSAIVLPAGLGVQWQQELRRFNPNDNTLLPLRSYDSFIAGFSQDKDVEGSKTRKLNYKKRLQDRRQQRELPTNGWAEEKILMISHSFAAMQFPSRGDGPAGGWRRELLPTVAQLVKETRRNLVRRRFNEGELTYVRATRCAASAIANTIKSLDSPCDLDLEEKNHNKLDADKYKDKILPLIGYGLGQFDLIVIDEAHKARGANSSLSRILGPITWKSADPFRLGMTATPVELDAEQWIDTLNRICGRDDRNDASAPSDMSKKINDYVDSVRRMQIEELDESLTTLFESTAKRFHEALRPYVLRRDKRHEKEFQDFQKRHGDYRTVEDRLVSPETEGFTHDWLRRFCAAEALSFLPQDNPRVKHARLSIAQGYGFSAASDETTDPELKKEAVDEREHAIWLNALTWESVDIYTHPAILASVQLIEEYTSRGEKVLVFGQFIEPMKALTRLLDAREMLRRLRDGQHWPAKSVHKDEKSHQAVVTASKDPHLMAPPGGVDEINEILAERYSKWSNDRKKELERLHGEIETLAEQYESAALLVDFLRRDHKEDNLHGDIGALLEALEARRKTAGSSQDGWTGKEIHDLFQSLLEELSGDNEDDNNETRQSQSQQLALYLQDYSGREGNFARMMSGETRPRTRRLLQAAFNRATHWPMVLLAQSRVGREGLNLHEACRTVVLLHAEWNPGVVEQQIGRVDRKNSRWLQDWKTWRGDGEGDPPRIRIHPVVVSGTYDDLNWQVLKNRWLALRAQLHGDVLPDRKMQAFASSEKKALIQRILHATPNFAPPDLGTTAVQS